MSFAEPTVPNGVVKKFTSIKDKNVTNFFVPIARTSVNKYHFVPQFDEGQITWTTNYYSKEGIVLVSVEDNSYLLPSYFYSSFTKKIVSLNKFLGPDTYEGIDILTLTDSRETFSLNGANDPTKERLVGKWYKVSQGNTNLKIKAYKTDTDQPWDDIIPTKTVYENVEIMFLPVNNFMMSFGKTCKTYLSPINLEGLGVYVSLTRLGTKVDCTGKWGLTKDGCIYSINSNVMPSTVKCEDRIGYLYGKSDTTCGKGYYGKCDDKKKRCVFDKGMLTCKDNVVPKKKKKKEEGGEIIIIIIVVVVLLILFGIFAWQLSSNNKFITKLSKLII